MTDTLSALLASWPKLAHREGILDRACILATRIGMEVLHHYGMEAEPYPCQVMVFNSEAWRLFCHEIPMERWPESAHSLGVGVGAPWDDKGWDGHLVIRTGDQLIDLAARQFHRPGRVELPKPIVMAYVGDQSILCDKHGQRFMVRRTNDKAYRQAVDWRRNWRPLVPKLIELMERDQVRSSPH